MQVLRVGWRRMPNGLLFRFRAFRTVEVCERIEGMVSGKYIYRVYNVWGVFGGWMAATESIRALLQCASHALLLRCQIVDFNRSLSVCMSYRRDMRGAIVGLDEGTRTLFRALPNPSNFFLPVQLARLLNTKYIAFSIQYDGR